MLLFCHQDSKENCEIAPPDLKLQLDSPPTKPSRSQEAFHQMVDRAVGNLASLRRSIRSTQLLADSVQTQSLSEEQNIFYSSSTLLFAAYPIMIGRFNQLLASLNSNWSFVRGKMLFNSSLWATCTPATDADAPFVFPRIQILAANKFLISESDLFAASRNLVAIRLDHSKFPTTLADYTESLTTLVSLANKVTSEIKQFFQSRHTVPYWTDDFLPSSTDLKPHPDSTATDEDDIAFLQHNARIQARSAARGARGSRGYRGRSGPRF